MWNRWSSKTRREDGKGGGDVTVIRGAKRWLQSKDRRNENGGKKEQDTEEEEMKVFWRPLYCAQSNICLSLYGSPLKWQLNKPVIFLRRLTSYTTGCMMVVCVCSLKCARWTNPVFETQIQMDSWEALCYCFPLAHKNAHICTLFLATLMALTQKPTPLQINFTHTRTHTGLCSV